MVDVEVVGVVDADVVVDVLDVLDVLDVDGVEVLVDVPKV